MDCHRFVERLGAFVADGLSSEDRRPLQEHLDACPSCARRVEMEASFDRALRARIPRETSPPGLATRVRAALRAEVGAVRGGRDAWWRRAWVPTFAATVLVAALVVLSPSPAPTPVPGVVVVHGRIVDHDCDRHGLSLVLQRDCDDPTHVNVLKLDDGTYVRIATTSVDGPDLVRSAALRGEEVDLTGRYFPATRTVAVERVHGL